MKSIRSTTPWSRPNRVHTGEDDGFTLVELLIVIGVMSILLAAIYGSFDSMSRFFTKQNVNADTQKKSRFALDTMILDIQLVGLNPHGVPGGGILAASSTSLRLSSDINFDGDFDDPFETVAYALNGTRLEQTNHIGTDILAQNVSVFRFTYFDHDGTELSEPVNIPEIRSVNVSITLTQPAGRNGDVVRSYNTRIRCRNL
jgi:prepilin-type N-terminal cleavage/methylation domain-containing protein